MIVRCQPSITHQHSPEDLREDLKDTALDGRDPNHRELLDIHMDTILSGGLFPDGHYFPEREDEKPREERDEREGVRPNYDRPEVDNEHYLLILSFPRCDFYFIIIYIL